MNEEKLKNLLKDYNHPKIFLEKERNVYHIDIDYRGKAVMFRNGIKMVGEIPNDSTKELIQKLLSIGCENFNLYF